MAEAIFRRIGEIAEDLGVRPYVVRYWEQELPLKLSERNGGGQRVYSADDVDKLARVKQRVIDQGVSVRKLRRLIQVEGLAALGLPGAAATPAVPAEVIDELKAILRLLQSA